MAERKTLLDFAIAASLAVLPVLLAVLLAVAAVARSASSPDAPGQGDRYVNVRQVAALKTFEHAIVRRGTVREPPPSAARLLEGVPACRAEWDAAGGLRGWLRSLSPAAGRAASPAERMAGQLAEIDRALAAFSGSGNRRVAEAVGLDAGRWFEAVALALALPVESPDYPGRKFALRCEDVATSVAALARTDGRLLQALTWRGTAVPRVLARWRADQFVEVMPATLARHNPWGGVPGCIYLAAGGSEATPAYYVAGTRDAAERVCTQPTVAGIAPEAESKNAPQGLRGEPGSATPLDDPAWSVPPSLGAMLQSLEALRQPSGALYRAYTASPEEAGGEPAAPTGYRYGPNRIALDGTSVDLGFSIDLTIDPALQAQAQKTVACYTGRQDACRALGLRRREDGTAPLGHRMLEGAMVRMAAVAIVDVASGRIEALAGALSPCTREEFDGPGRSRGCDPRLPYLARYRPDALLNPAVFHDAMPASTIKPILASTFLSDLGVGARWLEAERKWLTAQSAPPPGSLGRELMRSASPRFLDRLFCADQGFADCHRPEAAQQWALASGWNANCKLPRAGCGQRDLLFGRAADVLAESGQVRPLARFVPYGRLLVEPAGGRLGGTFKLAAWPDDPASAGDAASLLDPAALRQCAQGADGSRPSDDDWEKCNDPAIADAVAQGWGQGHARASALGAAGMMASIAAAANGESQQRRPHLVRALRGAGPAGAAQLESAVMRWSLARAEPNPLSPDAAQVILHALSYSHRGGTAQAACEQLFDAVRCASLDWIAGKTGTPTFPHDHRTLDQLARLCGPAARGGSCGALRPYKWYAAAYHLPGEARWTKAIAVLAERNWLRSGRIHGAGDLGPNPAAEIALQIAARQTGVIPEAGR